MGAGSKQPAAPNGMRNLAWVGPALAHLSAGVLSGFWMFVCRSDVWPMGSRVGALEELRVLHGESGGWERGTKFGNLQLEGWRGGIVLTKHLPCAKGTLPLVSCHESHACKWGLSQPFVR